MTVLFKYMKVHALDRSEGAVPSGINARHGMSELTDFEYSVLKITRQMKLVRRSIYVAQINPDPEVKDKFTKYALKQCREAQRIIDEGE